MHNFFKSFVAGCIAIFSSFNNHPKILGDRDDRDHRDRDHHEERRIDLKVNGVDNPPTVVSLDDVKPGDNRYVDKDIYVKDGDAKVFVHLTNLVASQGATTEPESKEENGVPKSDIQNYLYYDLSFGEKTIIAEGDLLPFPDAVSCWIPLGEVKKNKHVTATQSFHMPQSVTNWAQGDILTFTEEFIAVSPDAPTPVTGSGRVWSPSQKKCVTKPTATPTPTKKPKKYDH